jgi:hypothetical protein
MDLYKMIENMKKRLSPKPDGSGTTPGLKDKRKDLYETDKTAKDGPQGGPSFVSGSDQPGMPGNSTGEAAIYNSGLGAPGDQYGATWGESTTREGAWHVGVPIRKIP